MIENDTPVNVARSEVYSLYISCMLIVQSNFDQEVIRKRLPPGDDPMVQYQETVKYTMRILKNITRKRSAKFYYTAWW